MRTETINQDAVIHYPAKWGFVESAINESVNKAMENAVKNLLTDGVLKKDNIQSVRYYSRSETAKLLHVNLNTLYNYVKKGKINPVKLGGRVLFSSTEIDNLASVGVKYGRDK